MVGAGLLGAVAAPTTAGTVHTLKLCWGANTNNPMPAVAKLGNASQYPVGARTCSWTGKHKIKYSCKGGSVLKLDLVESHETRTGQRRSYRARCDGRARKLDAKAYRGLRGPRFHLHLHGHGWTSARLHVY